MPVPGLHSKPKSIQFWLTWLVVACILPAALGAAFLLERSYEQARGSLEAARIATARAVMQVVDSEFAGAATILQVLASSQFIRSGDFAGFYNRAAEVLAETSGNNIVLLGPSGEQIINTLKPFGTPLPTRSDMELQRRTLEGGKPVVSDVFIGPLSGRSVVSVQVPVFVEGQARYILAMGFFSERLVDILLRQNMPEGWVASIYDRKGTIAARTQAADRFVGQTGAASAVRYVAQSPEGAFEGVTLEGTPVQVTFSRSISSGWAVVIAIPTQMANASLTRSLWLNAAVAIAALGLGGELARRIGRRISRSIGALGIPALTLESGEIAVLPPIDIIEVDRLRTILLKAAHLIETERDTARQAERRMMISAAAAEQANRAKSEFLASMSHELRTPLHGILGYAEMLRLEGGLTQCQMRRVEVMLGAGQHLLGMINAVLDLSQIDANQLDLQPEPTELRRLALACLDVVRPAAEKKGLVLVLALGNPLWLAVDPTRLRQVLVNLLGNAIKFTQVGAVEVRLRQADPDDHTWLEVVDSGPGIPPEHRDKLFKSFERLDGKALRAVEGAGLGLALSARLVTLMGGRLVHDDNPGGGSIFRLELPTGDLTASGAGIAAVPGPQDMPVSARHMHVLVVDDVAMNRDIASAFLRAAGHQVACAESGEEAITAAANKDFDAVLMDVRMPGMDGLEATRRIRALQGLRGRVPIVALTAQAFTEQVAECRMAGMDSHLGKPFDQATLLAVLARAVDAGSGGAPYPGAVTLRSSISEAPAVMTQAETEVFDLKAFELAASRLPPVAVAGYLRTIAELGEDLLRDLREPDALVRAGDALAGAAHTLAGAAGMLGFRRLSVIGRNFERAVQTGSAEAPALADGLDAAVEATLQEIRTRLMQTAGHAS